MRALLADPGIVRNRLKVEGAVANARAFLALRDEPGGADAFLWRFVGGRPRRNRWTHAATRCPRRTPESDAMSRELKRRGFTFVGSTICYAFMQATGMVDDHTQTASARAVDKGPCFVGALGRALNVWKVRLARGLRAPPRSWTFSAARGTCGWPTLTWAGG